MRLAALSLLLAAAACTPSPSERRGHRPGDTQVVAQWALFDGATPQQGLSGAVQASAAVSRCQGAEMKIEQASGGLYFEDGNDIGRGRCNVFLYTDRVDETVDRLVGLMRAGRLPADLRIGVAVYKNRDRTDWDYRVAYPKTLTRFDLF